MELKISFPYDEKEKLRDMAGKFASSRSNRPALFGYVGALDGYAIRTRRPGVLEAANPNDYSNRKGFFALNMQAICGADCKFSYIFLDTPGSTHDATAFALADF